MPFLKNTSLRILYVGGVTILPGQVSSELPDEVMEYSGVKALMKEKALEEADDPESEPAPKRAAAPAPAAPQPAKPPQPPKQ